LRATFLDTGLERDLERDGFVAFPMLDDAQVAALRSAFDGLGPAAGDPRLACHSSFHTNDRAYKVAVDATVRAALGPHVQRHFDQQRMLPCNFISKWPSAMSGFGLHQDLTLVDESHHRSVEVWVALDDTNDLNGQLWMVPGSHRWLPYNIRGINGFDFPFNDVTRRIIERHSVPVPVRAGTAVVFNHATLHFSLPNRSEARRLVAITDLIPAEAEHLHFFGDGEGRIGVYHIDDSFWTDNNPFTLWKPPPESQRIGWIDATQRSLTDAELDDLVRDGLAIESDVRPHGAPNAAKTWCHRCGSVDIGADAPDRWVGNVTLLCESCREEELAHAASPDHVAARRP
jgi:hypothetical protein